MAESLLEVLGIDDVPANGLPAATDYLTRLCTRSLEALHTVEAESLAGESQSITRSLQSLSKRSYRSVNFAADALSGLRGVVPDLQTSSQLLSAGIPDLEEQSAEFAQKYRDPLESALLERRRRALRLSETVDKLADVLELPSLLNSTIGTGSASSSSAATSNYATALDLYAHIKRLQRLYPESELVRSIVVQADGAMRGLTSALIAHLRSHSLKLAAAMRLIGLLRRVAPELDDTALHASQSSSWHAASTGEGSLGYLFLVCRLASLTATVDALEPLRDLAEQESDARRNASAPSDRSAAWVAGQQTERYLKRYIEVFREQSFAIISMYRSIFPGAIPSIATGTGAHSEPDTSSTPPDQTIPSAVLGFVMHLVETLCTTLKEYLPNVQDRSSRESLLTQVLYCASSLGRLGGDFSLVLSQILGDADDADAEGVPEWMQVMQKHRVQASRLEQLASGVGDRSARAAT